MLLSWGFAVAAVVCGVVSILPASNKQKSKTLPARPPRCCPLQHTRPPLLFWGPQGATVAGTQSLTHVRSLEIAL